MLIQHASTCVGYLLYLWIWGVNSPSSYNCPPTFTKATKCRLTFSSKLGAYVRQEMNSLRFICVYACQIQCKLLLQMNLKLFQTSVCPSCALDSCVTRMLWRKQLNKKKKNNYFSHLTFLLFSPFRFVSKINVHPCSLQRRPTSSFSRNVALSSGVIFAVWSRNFLRGESASVKKKQNINGTAILAFKYKTRFKLYCLLLWSGLLNIYGKVPDFYRCNSPKLG